MSDQQISIGQLQREVELGARSAMLLQQNEQLQAVIRERDELKEKIEALKKEDSGT